MTSTTNGFKVITNVRLLGPHEVAKQHDFYERNWPWFDYAVAAGFLAIIALGFLALRSVGK